MQGLIDEKGNITDIGKAITAVNNGLREQIALKIRNSATDKILEDSINKQTELTDKMMKKIGKQLGKDKGSLSSTIRETINSTINEFTSSGNKDYAELQRSLLADIQQTYGIDAYKGVFNVKNVVVDLVEELRKSGNAVDEVKAKFIGMISEMTETSSVVEDVLNNNSDDPDSPVTPFSSEKSDKDKYQKKLDALDSYILQEKNKLLQRYSDGEINLQQYNRQLELIERERLTKLLDIYEVDPTRELKSKTK